jgi:hypothetical protein
MGKRSLRDFHVHLRSSTLRSLVITFFLHLEFLTITIHLNPQSSHASTAPQPSGCLLAPRPRPRLICYPIARALLAPGPAARCIDSVLAFRQRRGISQEDPPRSRSRIRQRQDGWKRSEGSTCARKGARWVSGWTDAIGDHDASEREEEV